MPDNSSRLVLAAAFSLCLPQAAFSQSTQSQPDSARVTRTALPETETLEEVVVTATRSPIGAFNVPNSVILADKKELQRYGAISIQDALARDASVKLSNRQSTSLFSTGLEVRGLSGNETSGGNMLVLLDGVPQRRMSFGGPYWGALPFTAIDRVELVKGPVASLYGRGALAGALQLFSETGGDTFGGDFRTFYEGTTDTSSISGSAGGPLWKGATGSISASHIKSDGWQPNTSSERWDIYGHVKFELGPDDTIDVFGGYFSGRQDAASPMLINADGSRRYGLAYDANLAIPGQNYFVVDEIRAGMSWTHEFTPKWRQKVTIAYWNGTTNTGVGRPSDSPASGNIVSRLTENRVTQEDSWYAEIQEEYKYQIATSLKGTLTLGSSMDHATWDYTATSIRLPGGTFSQGVFLDMTTMAEPSRSTWIYGNPVTREAEETTFGFFARNVLTVADRLDIHLGARYDHYEREQYNTTTRDRGTLADSQTSPSLGMVYRLIEAPDHALSVFGSWGRGFSPVFRAVGTTEVVNIKPETSESFELGLRGNALNKKIQAEVVGYHLGRNDVVAFNAATNNYENAGDWTVQGVETSFTLRPVEGAWLKSSYTWRKPTIESNNAAPQTAGRDIAFVARQRAFMEAGYRHTTGWFASGNFQWVASCFDDPRNQIKIPSYSLLGAEVGWQWKQTRISVYGSNLADTEYYADSFSGISNGSAFVGTPRTIGVAVQVKF